VRLPTEATKVLRGVRRLRSSLSLCDDHDDGDADDNFEGTASLVADRLPTLFGDRNAAAAAVLVIGACRWDSRSCRSVATPQLGGVV
jgi:hypothetical protein